MNLLTQAQSKAVAKKISLPKIREDDKDLSVVNRILTFMANARYEAKEKYTINDVSSLLDSCDSIDGIISDLENLEHFMPLSDVDTIRKGFVDIVYKYRKYKGYTKEDASVAVKYGCVLRTNKCNYIIIDDAYFKLKYNHQFSKFSYLHKRNLEFGFVSYSLLNIIVAASTQAGKRVVSTNEIASYLRLIYEEAYNRELNNKYSRNSGKLIATVRSNKKYQDQQLNRSTKFNYLGFRDIEVDTESYQGKFFEYAKFKVVENAWETICNRVPHASQKPALKFRKLGKHRASGLYVPGESILAVDVRATTSFIHEYGHYLDYCLLNSDEQLSLLEAFQHIVKAYKLNLKSVADEKVIAKWDYYITPTEIFARAFELWFVRQINSSTCLTKREEEYANGPEYRAFDGLLDCIYTYFNAINDTYREYSYYEYRVKSVVCPRFKETEYTNIGTQLVLDLF